ncbi:amidohydrolase [Flavobacteriaceae bacterium F89]|uniref:Amidohydrolase n=1 Tax=Cerina litoralis TaxID=2874477 RepID=A0AAE3EWY7_9FLAO|nr:amidohydrolase family protein [Cerina litoralis]MCG2461649.1 amidohydrolase [Cerina litoralis]
MNKLIAIPTIGIILLNLAGCQNSGEFKSLDTKDTVMSPENLLLKDWKPKSIYKVPVTDIEKAKFPVVDMHAHNYTTTPQEIAERVGIMDKVGIQKSVVFTNEVGGKFDSIYSMYSKYPDRFDVYCGFDFSGYQKKDWPEKAVKELRRCVNKGAVGVGELHDKGGGLVEGLHPDDPRMDPLFEACAELGIPVNLHMSDPKWMYETMDSTNDGLMRAWTWRVRDKGFDHNVLMDILANTLKRHPKTIFVASHLANCTFDLSILGRMFDKFPNLNADISARFSEFSTVPRATAAFFEKYQDRVVYGTDYGWEVWNKHSDYGNNTSLDSMFRTTFRTLETQDEHFYLTDLVGYKWPMYGLGLNDSVLKKIYTSNARRIGKQ